MGLPLFGDPRILSEDGDVLGPLEVGEVYFADNRGFEYFGEPEKTSKAFNDRGWATTGDMGYLDEHGFLYLTDRKDFTIISGGVNIYPAEIEGLLITHEKVADVAVFGIPDSDFGESVFAVVQPAAGVEVDETTEMELIEWMRERLSGIKIPRKIEFKDQLPRMDNGKLYKRHLINAHRH